MPSLDRKAKLRCALQAAFDQKAQELIVLNVSTLSSFTDYFVICHGESHRQVGGIARHIEEKMRSAGYKPLGIEGSTEGQWILMDYDDVVIHVFLKSVREFYDLERLWMDAPRVTLDDELSLR
ncbi:MAG TPA: ribosome silencing factor [Thermodesulfobacteriota bacterium]|nr:ribosome silencing factor [Deltaproteobacteria bacterium]HNR12179.1 ribosome silencing factor [Thermodesulfobacteriota bacterium]HNU72557.1 ribosome silencing factor [Thermodesulfobacteriota bacterium]HQO78985.1 ribosome silencing factor [Thermodesulfobacteriota bacterium]